MEISTIVILIGGLIIIAAIIAAVYIRFKTNPNAIDKNLADEFLNGLRDVFYYKMLDIVEGFNIEEYDSLEEMEVSILRDIYETLYSYTEEKMKEAAKEDIITAMALKVLSRQYIEAFLDKVMEETGIKSKIDEKCGFLFEKKAEEIEAEDKKLQAEFSDQSQYVEESNDSDLAPAEPTIEDNSDLNPPKDEVTYDDNSEGIEDIPEYEIISKTTATGKVYWYKVDANGKKTRIADPNK